MFILEGLLCGGDFVTPKPGSNTACATHLCQESNSLPSGKGIKGTMHAEESCQEALVAPPPVKIAVKYLRQSPRSTHGWK